MAPTILKPYWVKMPDSQASDPTLIGNKDWLACAACSAGAMGRRSVEPTRSTINIDQGNRPYFLQILAVSAVPLLTVLIVFLG